MKLRETGKVGVVGNKGRAVDALGIIKDNENRFEVREVISQKDLARLRLLYKWLVSEGRLNNASEIVSALALAYGKRPNGFDGEIEKFKHYIDSSSFNANGVLVNIVVAYPEVRSALSDSAKRIWGDTVGPQSVHMSLQPKEFVLRKLGLPNEQANLELDLSVLQEQETQLIKDISHQNDVGAIARKLYNVLLVDPSFKAQIPRRDILQQRFRHEIAVCRAKDTGNAWFEAAGILKALVLLSADHVGITREGQVFASYDYHGLSTPPPIPTRPLV